MRRLIPFTLALALTLAACGSGGDALPKDIPAVTGDLSAATPSPLPMATPALPADAQGQIAVLGLTVTAEYQQTQSILNATSTAVSNITATVVAAVETQAKGPTATADSWTATAVAGDITATVVKRDEESRNATATATAALGAGMIADQNAQTERDRLAARAKFENDMYTFALAALPYLFLLGCLVLLGVIVWWTYNAHQDWKVKRKDESMKRRLKLLPSGEQLYADENGWKPVKTIEMSALPSGGPPKLHAPSDNFRRQIAWDKAVWQFLLCGEELVNTRTGERGTLTENDIVLAHRLMSRPEWEMLTDMLLDANVLMKSTAQGTRYSVDDEGVTWSARRVREALLQGRLKLDYPTDGEGNIIPAPVVHKPQRSAATAPVVETR